MNKHNRRDAVTLVALGTAAAIILAGLAFTILLTAVAIWPATVLALVVGTVVLTVGKRLATKHTPLSIDCLNGVHAPGCPFCACSCHS